MACLEFYSITHNVIFVVMRNDKHITAAVANEVFAGAQLQPPESQQFVLKVSTIHHSDSQASVSLPDCTVNDVQTNLVQTRTSYSHK